MEHTDERCDIPANAQVEVCSLKVSRTAAGMRVALELSTEAGELPSCALESWSVRNPLGRTLSGVKGAFSFAGRGLREVAFEARAEEGNPLFISDGCTVTLKILTDSGFKTRAFVECGPSGRQTTCEYLRSPMTKAEQGKFAVLEREAVEEAERLDKAAAEKAARRAARLAARGNGQRPAEKAAEVMAERREERAQRRKPDPDHASCPACGAQADVVRTRRGKRALSCPFCRHYQILDL